MANINCECRPTASGNQERILFAAADMTQEIYETEYWPVIQHALKLLLVQPPGQCSSLSYEHVYGCVYKCVCKQFSERLFRDLCNEVKEHLNKMSVKLQEMKDEELINTFDCYLMKFKQALDGIIPLFNCMNRFYLGSKLDTDLRKELSQIFISVVVNVSILRILRVLEYAQAVPFTADPSAMSRVVKGLYNLCKEYVALSPSVFAMYIPNVLPPMTVAELPAFIGETHRLQNELVERGFTRGDQSRKRAGDDIPPNGTAQSLSGQEERKAKLQENLRNIGMCFKKLRRIYEKCNENCAGMEYTHIESLVPMKDEMDSRQEDKKFTEAVKYLTEEHRELVEQVMLRNRQLKEVIDNLRSFIWDINTMLAVRKP